MTDGQALYLTLLVLIVLEAVAWVPRGAVALVARGARTRAHVALPHRTLGNARGGAVLGVPLLPSAATFLVPQWPVSLAPQGVLGAVAECLEPAERPPHTGLFRRFDAITRVTVLGNEVRLDGELLVQAATPALAAQVAAFLDQLRKLPEDARAAAIDAHLAAQLDLDAARARVTSFYRETAWLRGAGLALALVALVVAPALFVHFGPERAWLPVLLALYLGTFAITALWLRAYPRVAPESRLGRWSSAFMLALLPVSAMRAVDALARVALTGVHPLAAAAALVPRDDLTPFVAHLLRDARWPLRPACPGDDPEAQAVEAAYRQALGRHLDTLVRALGLDPDALAAVPPPSGEIDDERCCPRCHACYGAGAATCEDCGGIPLVRA
ncbi:hypothetical protein [Chondromyces apiculatus]|uniref:Uncharacterized protein n=1 Tax=Chondromyces apiculatus DSM 436 TaxID=1192034 RepID=A0A017TFX0_9BACT|nr:hypothetical protein [Chondromyces apiculatus]EYF07720.1 Hypothetical protein CAP_8221 [Chondromyces apiculatus DSM 436]